MTTKRYYVIGTIVTLLVGSLFGLYRHNTSFNGLCSLKTKISPEYDANSNYIEESFISLDGNKIGYPNGGGTQKEFVILSAPMYNKKIIPVLLTDYSLDYYGFDGQNNFFHTETFEKTELMGPNYQAKNSYYNLYKNAELTETKSRSSINDHYKKYSNSYYSKYFDQHSRNGSHIFPSKYFGQVSSLLESDGYIYHRSYIIIGRLKVKVTNIDKPTIKLQGYSDETNTYTALINNEIYTCNLNKIKRLSGLIKN